MRFADGIMRNNPGPTSIFQWSKKRQDFIFVDYNQSLDDICGNNLHIIQGFALKELKPQDPDFCRAIELSYKKQRTVNLTYETIVRTTGEHKIFHGAFTYFAPDQVIIFLQDLTKKSLVRRLSAVNT